MISADTGILSGAVYVSEVMYNPWAGEQYEIVEPVDDPQWLLQESAVREIPPRWFEYIELYNDGEERDISGWSFSSGIRFTFPSGARIPAHGRVIACSRKEYFLRAYPGCDAAYVFGDWTGELHNESDTVVLNNATAGVVSVINYKDTSGWDCLPDGFGPSLERVCFTGSALDPENWRPGPVPARKDQFGGTPLAPAALENCPAVVPVRPGVKISEILYHPLMEDSFYEFHEFVEIVNTGDETVSLAGWRLAGGIQYTFPDVSVAPGEYLVIAYDRQALLGVEGYALDPDTVLGDYADGGYALDNGGDRIALVTAEGAGVDSVKYDDDFPWPVAADGLGAGTDWLPGEYLNGEGELTDEYRHRGPSLERISFSVPGKYPFNWAASPVDGATPGRPNTVQMETPRAVVEDIDLEPDDLQPGVAFDDPVFYDSDTVKIEARFSSVSPVSDVKVEYFIDDVNRGGGEARETLALSDDGEGADSRAGDNIYTGLFPEQSAGSIVRYRILAGRGDGEEVVSPRPSDPYEWFAYYVTPRIETGTRLYEIYISLANWSRMYSNASGGRVSGCQPRAGWDAKVPAVFVYKGVVYDVFVRYQGSRWNRLNGANIYSSRWPYPRPSGKFEAYSWHINFPRYNRMEGLRVVLLNKLTQSCPGFTYAVGMKLYRETGITAHNSRFVRLHINGHYYHYMQELERGGEAMMEKQVRRWNLEHPDREPEELGHLFKSAGCNCNEGPYGWGDERPLHAACGWTALQRYEYTYDPKIHEWDGAQLIMDLIEDLDDARNKDNKAVRRYFEKHFDMDLLMNYIAIMNWSVPFDDMFQNHFLYRRRSDGKWFVMPWDLDRNFGGWRGAGESIYMGEEGDRSNRSGWWNRIKDAFLKAYRPEYHQRLRELNNTILTHEFIAPLVDAVLAEADPAEANAAAAPLSCNFYSRANSFKSFAGQRHSIVNQRIPEISASVGDDFFCYVGEEILFDATGSYPDPAEGAVYTWSNGIQGDSPVHMFTEAGIVEIELVVTHDGKEASDSVVVTVLENPSYLFEEKDGRVVIEAESYHDNRSKDNTECWWEREFDRENYSGDGYMLADDIYDLSDRARFYRNYTHESPELRYFIRFTETGTYRLWVRGFTDDIKWDSVHVGIDGQGSTNYTYQRFDAQDEDPAWQWSNEKYNAPQEFPIDEPGIYYFSFWIRESTFCIDKFLFTTDGGYTPQGEGPAESEQITLAGEGSFVRGDANGDRTFDLSDPVTLLLQLFSARSGVCGDHGDVNDDGSFDIADAVYMLQYLFAGGDMPPEPFPAPGYDTTDDQFSCGDAPL